MRIGTTAYGLLVLTACVTTIVGVSGTPSEGSTAAPSCSTANLSLGFGQRVSPRTGEHGVTYTLTNRGNSACLLRGYPGVSLYDRKGRLLPFKYRWSGTQYVTHVPPSVVMLRPGARAYFLVAKYRCDVGDAMEATTIRVYPPNSKQ